VTFIVRDKRAAELASVEVSAELFEEMARASASAKGKHIEMEWREPELRDGRYWYEPAFYVLEVEQ